MNKETKSLSEFTNIYGLQKTLRFELVPVGKTQENLDKSKILLHDAERNVYYSEVKRIIDNQHRVLLERNLNSVPCDMFDWFKLASIYFSLASKSDKKEKEEIKKNLEKQQLDFRKKIVSLLKEDELYTILSESTPNKFFKKFNEELSEGECNPAIETFDGFACYFSGFQQNRANIYSEEAKSTAAAYRAIDVNFPKFLDNVNAVELLVEKFPKIIEGAEEELKDYLGNRKISSIFSVNNYTKCLSQKQIEFVNNVITGFTLESGKKIKGLNEKINLYKQQNSDVKIPKLRTLYKQILSEKTSMSFVLDQFKSDEDVKNAIKEFYKSSILIEFANGYGLDSAIKSLLNKITSSDDKIYVRADALSKISSKLTGSWSTIADALKDNVIAEVIATKKKATSKDVEKAWEKEQQKRKEYSISELSALTLKGIDDNDNEFEIDIAKYWINSCDEYITPVYENVKLLEKIIDSKAKFSKEDIAIIKQALDSVQNLMHFLKVFDVSPELPRDIDFYTEYEQIYQNISNIVPLYNKVRNYVTKKPYDTKKSKLMFDCSTLASGWDKNKESSNFSLLFTREGKYFLGIINKKFGGKVVSELEKLSSNKGDSVDFKKIVYKYLPGPNKMLPKVFFSKTGIAEFNPPKYILDGYQNECHKKSSANFDLKYCHNLIDWFKESINLHEEWKNFDFKFSPTSSYQDISKFYNEIAKQGYKISFSYLSTEVVDSFVDSGKLFLFEIHNKDFSNGTNGKKNIHTLYWESLFCNDNLVDVSVKLNGEAELFMRKASILPEDLVVHKKDSWLVNKRYINGKPIRADVFKNIYDFYNYGVGSLSQEIENQIIECKSIEDAKLVKEKYKDENKIIVKKATHDIIKDKRFTTTKYFFHVPISLNWKEQGTGEGITFNNKVNEYLANNPDVNIIGIDRGERHLLYLSLINQKGEILVQKSYNTIESKSYNGILQSTDYHEKLNQLEGNRDEARKNWETIDGIKDMKEGYLSQVVRDIADLMVKYNAIVILEDLNFGFKRGRFKVEKQVYQKFEKALIDKLNYLVFKDYEGKSPGGVLNGYQLTDKFVSFEKLGKQTGFLFYVPAGYTSKIDPTTGFTNLFNTKSCKTGLGIKEFFSKFDSIKYEEKKNAFAFAFDFDKFKTGQNSFITKWIVYSAQDRIVYNKSLNNNRGGEEEIKPTKIILDALKNCGIENICDGFDLKNVIVSCSEDSKTDISLMKKIFYAFDKSLQMRNSKSGSDLDYIQSPVLNSYGDFFDSRNKEFENLPQNADANGAYHIALKGLLLLKERIDVNASKVDLKISHEDWFKFVQTKAYQK